MITTQRNATHRLLKSFAGFLLVVFVSFSMQGCYVHRHGFGSVPSTKIKGVKVASAKALYLFGGGISLKQPDIKAMVGDRKDYQIKTSQNFVDQLVGGLTGQILCMRTVKIIVPADMVNK